MVAARCVDCGEIPERNDRGIAVIQHDEHCRAEGELELLTSATINLSDLLVPLSWKELETVVKGVTDGSDGRVTTEVHMTVKSGAGFSSPELVPVLEIRGNVQRIKRFEPEEVLDVAVIEFKGVPRMLLYEPDKSGGTVAHSGISVQMLWASQSALQTEEGVMLQVRIPDILEIQLIPSRDVDAALSGELESPDNWLRYG